MAEEKSYYVRIHGNIIEVTEEVYLTYYRMDRRARFLKEKDEQNGTVNYSNLDTEDTLGEEMIPDTTSPSVESVAIHSILKQKLYESLGQLCAEDRELLQALYFEELSERQYSERTGIPQRTVNYRRRRAVDRLRKFFEK